ncbi:MAG: acyl-CoA thioesterase [Muribaculaceae bacterium]|nr:acyl-CoA thioesterase [Muribaculaceae bacterium]
MITGKTHYCDFDVRDYEIDSEGIVNNAIYLHYMEHARHTFCREVGLSYEQMRQQGITPVVAKLEIAYRTPLQSCDHVRCELTVERRGPRFIFHQTIHNISLGSIAAVATVTIACLVDGRLSRGDDLAQAFAPFLIN